MSAACILDFACQKSSLLWPLWYLRIFPNIRFLNTIGQKNEKNFSAFFFSAFLYLRDYIRLNLIISFKFVVITSCNRFKSRKPNDVCAKQIDFSLKNTATLVKFTFFLILQQKFYDLLNWFNLSFFIIETSASQIGGFSMCRIPKWWK